VSGRVSVKPINPDFLDFVNYAVCKALSERYGKDESAELFRRAGEIGFGELCRLVGFVSTDPADVLREVGMFLERMGYMARINLESVTENEVIVEMQGVSVIGSSIRLTREGASPSHIMTNLMFAALKEVCGMEASIIDLTLEQPSPVEGYAREKWVLKRI